MIRVVHNRVIQWTGLLVAVVVLSACQTSDTSLRESGRSEAYITGFHDGRHSGMNEAGNYLEQRVKDVDRFEQDAEYRAGWLAGEQEGIKIQEQANAAVGAAEGYQIGKDAEKSSRRDINKAAKEATRNVDTEVLKNL